MTLPDGFVDLISAIRNNIDIKKPAEAGFLLWSATINRCQNRPGLRSAVLPGWQTHLQQLPAVQLAVRPLRDGAYDPGGTHNQYLPGSDDPR